MLANNHLARLMNYMSPSDKGRAEFMQDDDEDDTNNHLQSDLIKVALGLPYLADASNFEFNYAFMLKLNAKNADKNNSI